MKFVEDARVEVVWDSGSRTEIGTIHIESDRDGLGYLVNTKMRKRWIGWHFVKMGLRVMFGRRWRKESGEDDGTGADPAEH